MDKTNNRFRVEKKGIVYGTLFCILVALLVAFIIFAIYAIVSGKSKILLDILELILI